MNEIRISVPGKLYLAGEYGVVAGRTPALILPTKLCLNVVVAEALVQTIFSTQWKEPITFSFQDGSLPETFQGPWAEALRLVKRVLDAQAKPWIACAIQIASDLDQNDQKKWGLGSSGALTVGLVEALLTFHGIALDKPTLYKLCVLAQLEHLEETSFGDIACSVFQRPLQYHMPSRDFLRRIDPADPLESLSEPWPGLETEVITASEMPLIVVNTGIPAQTHKLVKSVLAHREKRWFKRRMRRIDECVNAIHKGWIHADLDAVANAVKRHHAALTKLGRKSRQTLVIPPMKTLFKTFKPMLQAWKFSGAGAGDNVLLFPRSEADRAYVRTHLPEGMTDLTRFIEGVKP
jgi:phosphomevalonate kinase